MDEQAFIKEMNKAELDTLCIPQFAKMLAKQKAHAGSGGIGKRAKRGYVVIEEVVPVAAESSSSSAELVLGK